MQAGQLKLLVAMTGSVGVLSFVPQLRMWQGAICTQMEVILSDAAQQFVTASAVRAAAVCPVHADGTALGPHEERPPHVRLAEWCDALIVAPATANSISSLANGRADSLLTLCALGMDKPRVVVPNMNTRMWRAPAVQRNLLTLVRDGWTVLGVSDGADPDIAPQPQTMAPDELAMFISASIGRTP